MTQENPQENIDYSTPQTKEEVADQISQRDDDPYPGQDAPEIRRAEWYRRHKDDPDFWEQFEPKVKFKP